MKSNRFGFTLIELLVVVTILAILLVAGAVGYNAQMIKSRDGRRLLEMKEIKNFIERYMVENSSYPAISSEGDNNFTAMKVAIGSYARKIADFEDPLNSIDYQYYYQSDGDTFCLCAHLEKGTGNSGVNCSFSTGTEYFCSKSFQ